MTYGFKQSVLDGSEHKFEAPKATLPTEFSYLKLLPEVLNQSNEPTCVPCSIDCHFKWNKEVNKVDKKIDIKEVFNKAGGTKDGMSFKDAFKYLKKESKVSQYAMIGSIEALKHAIVLNGPCVGALPVYNSNFSFWRQLNDTFQGGHAIAIVGYDKDGFIIRNSWGKSYGHNGYSHIDYKDFDKFYEIWTIV